MNHYRSTHYGPNDRRIAAQAAQWRLVLQTGDARAREAFADWLLESRRHVRNYLLLAAFEQQLKQIDPQRRHDVDALLADAATDVVALESDGRSAAPSGRTSQQLTNNPWRWVGAVAAGILIAVLATHWLPLSLESGSLYTTGTGEQQTLKLTDGSVVYLNAQSRLRVDFSTRRRDVQLLDGEALFAVEKDSARPFNVIAGPTRVQAIGTQFNVRRIARNTVVSVVEGRVRVETGSPAATGTVNQLVPTNIVAAGEEARVEGSGRIEKAASANIERRVAWRQRILEFREDELSTVIAEFNRYNLAPRLRLESAELGTRHYTGVFKADDPESLAQLLAEEGGVIVDKSPAEIVIRRRPQ